MTQTLESNSTMVLSYEVFYQDNWSCDSQSSYTAGGDPFITAHICLLLLKLHK